MLLPAISLAKRELVRFFRQRGRVIGAMATPIMFWLIMGSGIGSSFSSAGNADYLKYAFAGTTTMILLFTSIFASISIIEDRREGFLQSVLASPAPRASIVLGKVLGGTALGFVQAFPFLLLAPTVHLPITALGLAEGALSLALTSFFLSSVGFFFAWRSESVAGFHGIMNVVLMPMWLVSGALFPLSGARTWMQLAMRANPLTYGLSSLKMAIIPEAHEPISMATAFSVIGLCALGAFLLCAVSVKGDKA